MSKSHAVESLSVEWNHRVSCVAENDDPIIDMIRTALYIVKQTHKHLTNQSHDRRKHDYTIKYSINS